MTPDKSLISLAVLDDHPIICRSFDVLCADQDDLIVVGKFSHSKELFNWLQTAECDVLVLDYILQNDQMDGLTLIKYLVSNHPHLRILLSTSIDSLAVIRTAYMLGVSGYIAKREESTSYLSAIRTIANGQRYIPNHIASELGRNSIHKLPNGLRINKIHDDCKELFSTRLLTSREAEVVNYILEGMELVDIATKLKRSRKTISGHKQSAMRKMGVSSDLELFKYRDALFCKY
ncbi:response regulator transcription factor [Pantoea sp. JK]|uniref:response regulator transcription factor n=1 Tax=Pantoea sp. JK TaxID=2871703 RepID=UPI0022386326|nr:response regulator transcription factor [Pantoea sp. JK]MCW6034472.1 response regulator transcription factor [Pantoea sp. JK]